MPELHGVQEVIGGRFQILRYVGSGGEADVHLAHDLDLGLDVVLKSRPVTDLEHLGRLRREARVLMGIVPHRALPIVRSDLVDGDRYVLISDYVPGVDLQSILSSRGDPGLPIPAVLGYLKQLAGALDHLHGHSPPLVHGDVKPENLILAGDGRLTLIDFGAALRIGDDDERLGTPGFSAPEVTAGESLTEAADVFSLGAVALYLLTGKVPIIGTSLSDELAAVHAQRLERVLRRSQAFNPAHRPASASEFVGRLREAAEMDVPTGTVTLALVTTGETSGWSRTMADIAIAMEDTGGRVVSSATIPAGAVLAAFTRVHDALTAGLEVMGLGAPAGSTRPTVGLHAGDLGGWHGATLQQLTDETLRLTRVVPAGMLVCSPPVRMLVGGDDSIRFDPIRHGFRVERTVQPGVRLGTTAHQADAARWIATRRSAPVVGRTEQLAGAFTTVARDRHAGRASFTLVVGEPGMGKTRLLAELAGRTADTGSAVLVGRCSEAGGAFEPFLDALGEQVFPFESGQLERDDDGWIDRRRFFTRIATELRSGGDSVTLVLDDVQWIDGSSLALLSQLMDELGGGLTVYAACRSGAETRVRAELTGHLGVHTIVLPPLARAQLGELADLVGADLPAAAIESLCALTGGNPFFGLQLIEHLRDWTEWTLDDADVPIGVREWILQRVSRLGDDARATLAPAAVMGRSFEVMSLADVLGVSPLEALGTLDRAATAGLLIDGDHPGEFRFVHAIVRTALIETLSPARKALLHAAIGRRLEAAGDDLDSLELAAHHWLEADRLGDPLHAAKLAVEVATRVLERLAHEAAIAVLDRALAVLASAGHSPERDRAEARARVAYGRAEFFGSYLELALAQLLRAAELAESGDDPTTLAHAALAASLHRRHGRDDPNLLGLLERASDRCPTDPAVLPAMLHVRRARLLPAAVRHEERCAIARRGLEEVDRMDPVDRATVETEVARACWGPDDASERALLTTSHIDQASRKLAAGEAPRWTGVLIEAFNHRSAARVQLGDLGGALTDAREAARIADEAGSTFLLTRVRMGEAMINATLGNHDEAERLAGAAVEMSGRHNLVLAQMAISFCIGRDRGRQGELAELERRLGAMVDDNPLFIAAFALVHAEIGHIDDAHRLLTKLVGVKSWPRNWLWLATSVAALETAVLVEEPDLVRRLTALLTRYTGQWALAGAEVACFGPVDRVLGIARDAIGQPDEGRRLLHRAADAARTQGAVPWLSRCESALALR